MKKQDWGTKSKKGGKDVHLANITLLVGKHTGRVFCLFSFDFEYFEGKLNWKTELKMEILQEGFWFGRKS